MDIETIKIMADVFKSMSEDAILGVSIFFGLEVIKTIIPWGFSLLIARVVLAGLISIFKGLEITLAEHDEPR